MLSLSHYFFSIFHKDVSPMKYLIALSIVILSACSSTPEVSTETATTNVPQLIEQAKRRFPHFVRGTFNIPIKATGSQNGRVFLNSNLDYREPTNLTVSLDPETIENFTKIYNSSPELYFKNKTVEVTGKVQRVRIYQYSNGKRTKKYYYQTHIRVSDVKQINVVD